MFEEAAHSSCLNKYYQTNCLPLAAVTDADSCPRPLTEQLERIAAGAFKPAALLLRAKNLSPQEYFLLAEKMLPLCQKQQIKLILHTHWQCAHKLEIKNLHLPLNLLAAMPAKQRRLFTISTSVHSVAEAQQALNLGAKFLLAGHIYATGCKANLPPRGLNFLRAVCQTAAKHNAQQNLRGQNSAVVYAIGGIKFDGAQWQELQAAGAAGACIMSAYMQI